MNHQELLDRLSTVSGIPIKELPNLLEALPLALADLLNADESIAIPGFGTFEVHKRLERVVENAATGRRTLTPPRLVLRFRNALALHPNYTLHNLANQLVRRRKIDTEKALQLVAQCFGTLYEGLQTDGFASLVGFGTFHMETETEKSQQQFTFTPDESLAALINRPFAELPEVELNPDTNLRDLEAVNAEFEKPAEVSDKDNRENETTSFAPAQTASTSNLEYVQTESEESPTELAPPSSVPDISSPATDNPTKEADSVSPAITSVVPLPHPTPTESDESDTSFNVRQFTDNKSENNSNLHWRRAATVFAIAALGLLIFILLRLGHAEVRPSEPELITIADTVQADTLPVPSQRTQRFMLNDPAEVFTHFEVDGLLDEHTVEFGDILIRLAEHYYGNPYFVKFIIDYNGLPASGEATPGTVLRIPHLRRKAGL